jgi:hypothetical protein
MIYNEMIRLISKTEAALKDLKVPTTLPDFLAWKEIGDSKISNPMILDTQSEPNDIDLPRTLRSEMKEK